MNEFQVTATRSGKIVMNDGGPAFPSVISKVIPKGPGDAYPVIESFAGMSLRDWFAGQALAGLLANDPKNITLTGTEYCNLVSVGCYGLADAMLQQRQKEKE